MPLCAVGLSACKLGDEILKFSGLTMGTTFSLTVVDAPRAVGEAEVQNAVNTALATVNKQMSNWDETSEISRFNASKSTDEQQISPELAEVMTAAEQVHIASGGSFDTTVGPLIELWGFGGDDSKHNVPSAQDIQMAAQRSGHGNTLRVGSAALQKKQDDVNVYLSAIGKGFGADLIGRELEKIGVKNYLIEIGGDLYAAGYNAEGSAWQIGIETPDANTRGLLDRVSVANLGMASSGDYRNFFEVDGTEYSHLIDPRTGHPVTHTTKSATVLAESAMLADAWATALHVMGQEEGLALAEREGIAVLFTQADVNGAGFTTTESARFTALRSA
ncbi:thiamin biosynthesis lipoprotein ApbE [Sulfitobacter donghicola DSW-25 = KCTC 12864 = JCM 14565]|uniref:FAD:protein FMN transferase n=2 Tax=Sulfitobacter TaxID=60136 RepID=A0A073IED8_9RHOB|nr:thiamin biosynthesis lipoprotein ApbE [Sulfitobacter donghicola DSW-25 = KCTC 12864 = JCM 14565]